MSSTDRLRDRVRRVWLKLGGGQRRAAERLRASVGQTTRRRSTAIDDYLVMTEMRQALLDALAWGPEHDDVIFRALQRDPLRALSCTLGHDVRLDPSAEGRVIALVERLAPPGTPAGEHLLRAWLFAPNGERPGATAALERTMAPWVRPLLTQPVNREDDTLDLSTLDRLLENPSLTASDLAQIYQHATQRSRRLPTVFLLRLLRHPAHPPTLPAGAADLVRSDLQQGHHLVVALDIAKAYPALLEGLQLPGASVAAVFDLDEPIGLRLWNQMPPGEAAALWRAMFEDRPERALGVLASLSPAVLQALGFHRDDVKRLLRDPDKQIRTGDLALVGVLPSTPPASSPAVAPPVWDGEPEPLDAACHDPQLAAWYRARDPAVAEYRLAAELREAVARSQRLQADPLLRARRKQRRGAS